MNVYDAVRSKRSIRQFGDRAISDEDLTRVLNAGRLAGSSKNSQPWHFIVLRDRERSIALSKLGAWAGHLVGRTWASLLSPAIGVSAGPWPLTWAWPQRT